MAAIVIHDLDITRDGTWSFHDDRPTWRHHQYGSIGTFDPFPAYPHDHAVVAAAVEHVQQRTPLLWDIELYLANREERGRSNGYSNIHESGHYDDDGEWVKDPPVGLIVFSGKRIPPHPALSRYLVAHEVGHQVYWMLNGVRGARHLHDDDLIREYAERRGLPQPVHHGSGGRWHDSAHEVFACDFRILACDIDPEYWPHAGVPHPSQVTGLAGWWEAALNGAWKAAQQRPIDATAA